MKVWELIAWLKEQNQMADVEVCTDPESGKYILFDPEQHAAVDENKKLITIFC